MIVIIDYGVANLGSLLNMFKKIGVSAQASANPEEILKADKIVLPGVGAFDPAMEKLNSLRLIPILHEMAFEKKRPFLGVCLGMQLLTEKSEEGTLTGLGWIPGKTVRFTVQPDIRIPHMGWNTITPKRPSPLLEGLDEHARFYFVHSFFVQCADSRDILAETTYGNTFTSMVQRGNIFGAQFHPEKSHKFGMQILSSFSKLP